MKYQCYSCGEKQKKSKSGGNAENILGNLAKFAVGKIPFVGDNIVNATGLDKYEADKPFFKTLQNIDEKFINPALETVGSKLIDGAIPGLGTAISTVDNIADDAQGVGKDKKTGKSLNGINPLDGSRYAQTGGQVNSVKKVDGGTLNKISSTGIKAEGRLHEHGGININDEIEIEGGEGIHKLGNKTVISSDTLQDSDGYTFAEKMTELESKKGYLENRLKIEEDKGNKNTVIVLKKKIAEIDNEIKELYGKQELTAKEMGLRDKNGNPNQASQDIVPSPENPNPTGMMGKFGGNFKFKNEMNYDKAKSGGWIQKVNKSIEKRGTEGRCTGSNFGGPDCPPGSRQYNLAVTFKKMAKREMGGLINTTGYLKGHNTNKNPYNIIPSNIITTMGMKFPIEAISNTGDKKILYPNQKEKVVFKGNYVVEKPLKAQNGATNIYGMPLLPTVPKIPSIKAPKKLEFIPKIDKIDYVPEINATKAIIPTNSTYSPQQVNSMLSADKRENRMNTMKDIGKYAYSAMPAIAGIGQFIARKNDKPFSYLNEKPQGMTEWNNSIKNSQYNLSKQFGDQQNTALATLLRSQTDNNSSSPAELNNFGANMSNEFNKYMIENNRGIMDQYQKYAAQDAALKQGERTDRYDLFAQRRKDLDQMRNDLVKSIGESVKNFGAQYNLDSNQEYIKNMIKQFPVWLQNEILQNIAEGK